jgi:hypothetical protein
MNKTEPPSPEGCQSPLFLVGKDSHGNWVVQNQSGLSGGLFVSRDEALKFAMFESGGRPQSVMTMPGVFELNMNSKLSAGARSAAGASSYLDKAA